ncbi:MAG TPA: AAA family ATPase [bacterium]|nr:AAA family ATPase [bacterium]
MKRMLELKLQTWKKSPVHKPIVLKGARQVGKSFLVREFGKSFNSFVEVNFDFSEKYASIFELDLDPERIIKEISFLKKTAIVPGETLLFLDEIQECPNAIKALRYFYEMMPDLHLIAAGSLLEFALENIGLPVGRVTPMYLYPMSFKEFAQARNTGDILFESAKYFPEEIPDVFHSKLLKLLGEYMVVGGMPEVVFSWINEENFTRCREIQNEIIEVYKSDFMKYAKKHQVKYVDLLYSSVHTTVGRKFTYSSIGQDFKSRELKPALDLLIKADVIHKISHSSFSTIPLKAGEKPDHFKLIMSDIGLMQAMLNNDVSEWIIRPQDATQNFGSVTEAFVGQEILANASPMKRTELFYWARSKRGANAEVDYLIEKENAVIPIEVKAGKSSRMVSMEMFLNEKPEVRYGIHLSILNNRLKDKIHRFSLYLAGSLADISD